jgi:hypothetical protein
MIDLILFDFWCLTPLSTISWRPVLVVEEARVHKKKQKQKKLLKAVASKVLAYYIPYTRSVVYKPFICLNITE